MSGTETIHRLSEKLHDLIVTERLPPARAVPALMRAHETEDIETFLLGFIETALSLEVLYDGIKRDEWNDWRRVDYWDGISHHGNDPHNGSAQLLLVKSELYRTVAFLSLDMLVLRRSEPGPLTAGRVIEYWEQQGSEFFLD